MGGASSAQTRSDLSRNQTINQRTNANPSNNLNNMPRPQTFASQNTNNFHNNSRNVPNSGNIPSLNNNNIFLQNNPNFLNSMNSYLAMTNMRYNFPNMLPIKNPGKTVVMNTLIAIRKKTVKLEPINQNENEYFLSFFYDSIKEAEITIFMLVEEIATPLLITKDFVCGNKKRAVAPLVKVCPGGKNMQFPKCFRINLELYPEGMYLEAKENYYPLVIKLKINTEEDKKEKTTILYNYLTFCHQDNKMELKFLKQKMEIDADAYIIEEIYGINSSELTKEESNAAEVDDTNKDCVVCFSEKIDTIIMPCRHMCLCITCANALQKSTKPQARKCPICRKNIESFIRLQRGETKK